jgi:hypothetical protein
MMFLVVVFLCPRALVIVGRMTQRTEAEGTSTWTYDTKSKGIGKPAVITGPNGYMHP